MEKNIIKKSDGYYDNGEANLVILSEYEFLETIGVGKLINLKIKIIDEIFA